MMSDNMKHIILANINVKLYSVQLTPYVSQGSAATDLRGGGCFNSFFPKILSEFNSENIMKIGPRLSKLS